MNCFYSKPKEYPIENKVKNLGWVLRYSRNNLIRCVEARQENGTYGVEGCLRVFFDNGTIFVCDFASHKVLCEWIKSRRSWRGVTLHHVVYGQSFLTTKI